MDSKTVFTPSRWLRDVPIFLSYVRVDPDSRVSTQGLLDEVEDVILNPRLLASINVERCQRTCVVKIKLR